MDRLAPRRWPGSITRSTAPSGGRFRSRTAASRCGSPAAARRRRSGSPPSTPSYTNFDATPEEFQRKSEILAEHCKDVGTDFDAIVRSANFNVIIGETEKDVADKLDWVRAHYEPLVPAEALERNLRMLASGPLVGTPEQITERLAEVRKLGLTYTIGNFPDAAYDRASINLFAEKVIPELAG